MRIQSTVNKTLLNAIRRHTGASLLAKGEADGRTPLYEGPVVEVFEARYGVVGDSRLERGCAREGGRSLRTGHHPAGGCPREVRVPIVAGKRGNARGAKGGREANRLNP
jgi:hypothetical protein